ncbi:MAG: hypothetical protein KBS75_08215 [Bacteroidales bacterium]|nr:hypothetical protein [Candidatus Equimonas faecalis]
MKTSSISLKSLLMGFALAAATSVGLTSCMDDMDEGLYDNDFAAENMVISDVDTTLLNFYQNWRSCTKLTYQTEGRIVSTGAPWADHVSVNSRIPDEILRGLKSDTLWHVAFSGFNNPDAYELPYIIFYNKMSGIARVLYFSTKSSESDQVFFVVQAQDRNSVWNHAMNYGVPDCATAGAKCVNYFIDGNEKTCEKFCTFIRPYNDEDDMLAGQLTFEKGWYAFDMDMSSYNGGSFPNFKIFATGKSNMDVNLFSSMTASSKGDITQDIHHAAVSSAFGNFTSLSGILKSVTHVYNDYVKDGLKLVASKGTDVGSYLSIGKTLYTDITTKSKPASDEEKGWGHIVFTTTGTISSSGTISKNESTNVPCLSVNPDAAVNSSSLFGQGVWNIVDKPVVYVTDNIQNGYLRYFLDPTSIKVKINPNLSKGLGDIQNIHVTSFVCAYTADSLGHTDIYQTAIYGNAERVRLTNVTSTTNKYTTNMHLKCLEENGYTTSVKGCNSIKLEGTPIDGNAMIEPLIKISDTNSIELPDLVVVVNLSFNLNGQTYFYTKRFIPSYKKVSLPTYENKALDLLENVYFDDYVMKYDGRSVEYVLPELSLGHLAQEFDTDMAAKIRKKNIRL